MKLQVERDHLADAVAWTARALPARPTAPVLVGMRLHAGAELTLSTFDYEVSAQATVPVITDEEGAVLVSGRLLAEIVRSLPAKPVDMVTDGTRATLKCGSATFTLVLLPEDEYPTLPEMPPLGFAFETDRSDPAIHSGARRTVMLSTRFNRWTIAGVPSTPGLYTFNRPAISTWPDSPLPDVVSVAVSTSLPVARSRP